MRKLDLKHVKQKIGEINAIVETCPDAVKEKCFELLFAGVFGGEPPPSARGSDANIAPEPADDKQAKQPAAEAADQNRKLPSNVLAFARRHKITIQDLEKLFLLDHEPLLPVYKIPAGNITQAQLYKVMMVLLENGLLNNQLSAPYPELRETVKEDGLFDGNFNKMLKRNHSLFKVAVTKDGIKETGTVELTGAGPARLAELIKELGQA